MAGVKAHKALGRCEFCVDADSFQMNTETLSASRKAILKAFN